LDPPEETVAPIAPFRSDEQLAGNLPADLGHPVGSPGGVGQDALHAPPQLLGFEETGFRFLREQPVEVGDGGRICRSSSPELN